MITRSKNSQNGKKYVTIEKTDKYFAGGKQIEFRNKVDNNYYDASGKKLFRSKKTSSDSYSTNAYKNLMSYKDGKVENVSLIDYYCHPNGSKVKIGKNIIVKDGVFL